MPPKSFKLFDSEKEAQEALPPGGLARVAAGGFKLCLGRTDEGFFVFDESCPHSGAPMSRGRINYLGEVVCPWHAYRFSLKTGLETTGKDCRMRLHKLEVRADGVFIVML